MAPDRGAGITAFLESGGTLEKARQLAAHASTRTTQLYDRREDRVTLDEVVKIIIFGGNAWVASTAEVGGIRDVAQPLEAEPFLVWK